MSTNLVGHCVGSLPRGEAIARLNDQLRINACGGQLLMTRGVQEIGDFDAPELLDALAKFDQFDPFNDPHGERDFGCLDLWGAELLWKIDYYSPDLLFGSDDPANSTHTHRVLTVLLAEEY